MSQVRNEPTPLTHPFSLSLRRTSHSSLSTFAQSKSTSATATRCRRCGCPSPTATVQCAAIEIVFLSVLSLFFHLRSLISLNQPVTQHTTLYCWTCVYIFTLVSTIEFEETTRHEWVFSLSVSVHIDLCICQIYLCVCLCIECLSFRPGVRRS